MTTAIDTKQFTHTNLSQTLTDKQKQFLQQLVQISNAEDIASGDITTLATVPKSTMKNAIFIAKANGVISGIAIVEYIFHLIDSTIQCRWSVTDSTTVTKNQLFGYITGNASSLLQAERLVLNVIQRMSGIATETSRYVQQIHSSNSKSIILDTRKTVPGLRIIDKLAVVHGGGQNHRYGLYDMFMIKDNHISAAGGIEQALQYVTNYITEQKLPSDIQVELEVRTEQELQQVLQLNNKYTLHRIMLDNMVKVQYTDGNVDNKHKDNLIIDITRLSNAVKLIDNRYETEASGNVNLGTVAEIAKSNVTYISVGALTHSVTAFDISLKILDDDGTLFTGHTEALTAHSAV